MKERAFATIDQLRAQLDAGEITREQLFDYHHARFETFDGELGSAIEVFDRESSLEKERSGPLSGVPGLIKNNISMKGRVVSCASNMLKGFRATYDATAVARLKEAGAVLMGSANLDEFAMGSSTETSAFKKTKNPWDATRVPGGSSGGSAAAVAAGLVPWSLGSDTGGSVRQPAAYCGIVGMKPTYGLVSRYGLVAYGSSLDTIGVFSRTVADNARVMSVIAGHDVKDSSSLFVDEKDYLQAIEGKDISKVRIGIVDNALNAEGMNSEISAAIEAAVVQLTQLGFATRRVELPTLDYSAAAYFILSRAEAASNLARFDGVRYGSRAKDVSNLTDMYAVGRHDGFGPEVRTRIMVGNYVLSAGHADDYYENAKTVKRMIRRELVNSFKDVDLLLMPTHPVPAFKFGAYDVNRLQMDLQDYFTCSMNLAGIPAISVPCGMTQSGMPIGMQLAGPHLSEGLIYAVAHAYEQATEWHTMHPAGFSS